MVVFNIPLTLILMSFGIVAIIGIVSFIGYIGYIIFSRIEKRIKQIETFIMDVPIYPPDVLDDLLKRSYAIQEYNKGNKEHIQQYWKEIEEKRNKTNPKFPSLTVVEVIVKESKKREDEKC